MDVVDITYTYSDKSLEALERLIDKIAEVFHLDVSLKEMFYTGVFCKSNVYANYFDQAEVYDCLNVPDELVNFSSTPKSRESYVDGVIDQIMLGQVKKPEWMVYVEAHATCGEYERQPSTYLRLYPKNRKYSALGDTILAFLYSVNSLTDVALVK